MNEKNTFSYFLQKSHEDFKYEIRISSDEIKINKYFLSMFLFSALETISLRDSPLTEDEQNPLEVVIKAAAQQQ